MVALWQGKDANRYVNRPPDGSAGTQQASEHTRTGHQVAALGHSNPVHRNAQATTWRYWDKERMSVGELGTHPEMPGHNLQVNPLPPFAGLEAASCTATRCS